MYRPTVAGIILSPKRERFLIKERGIWKFPQGGVRKGESRRAAIFRELDEELDKRIFDWARMAEREHTYEWSQEAIDSVAHKPGYAGFTGTRINYFILGASDWYFALMEPSIEEAGWFSHQETLDMLTHRSAQLAYLDIAENEIRKYFRPRIMVPNQHC